MVFLGFECIKGIPTPCPENTFNREQNGSCQPCPPGGVTFEEGSVECVIVKVNLPSKPAETVLSYFFCKPETNQKSNGGQPEMEPKIKPNKTSAVMLST